MPSFPRKLAWGSCVFALSCSLLVEMPVAREDRGTEGGADATADATADAMVDAAPNGVDPLARGLVAYWSFDEGAGVVANDLSGMDNHATLQTGASWAAGKVGGAIAFDGDAGQANVGENGTLQLSDEISIAFWVNIAAAGVGVEPRIIAKHYAYYVKMNIRSPELGSRDNTARMNVLVPDKEWHHVAFTFVRGEVHAYYDGREVPLRSNSFVPDAGLAQEARGSTIGDKNDTPAPLNGRLDELRVYNRALTAAEIGALSK